MKELVMGTKAKLQEEYTDLWKRFPSEEGLSEGEMARLDEIEQSLNDSELKQIRGGKLR